MTCLKSLHSFVILTFPHSASLCFLGSLGFAMYSRIKDKLPRIRKCMKQIISPVRERQINSAISILLDGVCVCVGGEREMGGGGNFN